jgi:hypothetical protein
MVMVTVKSACIVSSSIMIRSYQAVSGLSRRGLEGDESESGLRADHGLTLGQALAVLSVFLGHGALDGAFVVAAL